MQRRFLLCALGAQLLFALPSAANAAIYLELGTALSAEQAQQNWTVIQKTYPELRGLSFSTSQRSVAGGQPVYRLQAGPLSSREKAASICRKLFAQDQECFVSLKSSEVLPWQSKEELPWQQAESPKEADVPVAQAVVETPAEELSEPVLLAQQTRDPSDMLGPVSLDPQETADMREESAELQTPPVMETPLEPEMTEEAPEPQEPEVVEIAQVAPSPEPMPTPIIPAADNAGTIDVAEAIRVPVSEEPITVPPAPQVQPVQERLFSRGPRYRSFRLIEASETNRDRVLHVNDLSGHLGYPTRPRKAPTPKAKQKHYWVHLGSAHSRADAQTRWDSLRRQNPKLFYGKKAHISAPASMTNARRPAMRLRTGPFDAEKAAESYCRKLQASRVSCLVIHDF